MTTIAEGVETPEQLEMLAHLGCDQSQGYLHSRPLAVADLEPLLRNGLAGVSRKLTLRNLDVTAHRPPRLTRLEG